ncbi:MAG: class I lanthipeptide [Bacteroidales bacterium]
MATKKLKKLTLKKEVILRLEDGQMNRVLGQGNFCPTGNGLRECSHLASVCYCTDNACTKASNCCSNYTCVPHMDVDE